MNTAATSTETSLLSPSSEVAGELPDRELRAWVFLTRAANGPNTLVRRLIGEIGVLDAADAVRRHSLPNGFAELASLATRGGVQDVDDDLRIAERVGAHLVTPGSAEWPAQSFAPLDRGDASVDVGVPVALWCRGSARLNTVASSAIVLTGSRASTSYGEYVASSVSSALASHERTLLGGASYGIEGVAARAAVQLDGVVAAVLPCGIDRNYPAGHSELLRQIAESGLIVSEYPLGARAANPRFRQSHRLVAALAAVAVIVEAGRRSGALAVAEYATLLGTPLGAIPGPITSALSHGPHQLLARGTATLVTDADGILDLADGVDRT